MKALLRVLIIMLASCNLCFGQISGQVALPEENLIVPGEEVNLPESSCIEKIIAADSQLGKIRNHACEKQSLSLTISEYIAALKKLDYSGCPEAFVKAFNRHQQAWLDMIPVTDKYPELRGEMHDLFDIIERASDAETFKIRLKGIWDTWAEVEAAMK